MMDFIDLLLLAIALAMDCFTVSMVSGAILRKTEWKVILWIAFLFGFFQAMMPLLGWLGTTYVEQYIEAYDHWIAFGLLAFIGIRMIRESFLPEEERFFNPRKLGTQILLAIATSIDALAVGISFVCTGYHTLKSLTVPLWIIGIVSFLFSVIGNLLGIRFGKISHRFKPELAGGIILIAIGCKILWTHLCS
jgi:putative Mn2+ efflux pump MntP